LLQTSASNDSTEKNKQQLQNLPAQLSVCECVHVCGAPSPSVVLACVCVYVCVVVCVFVVCWWVCGAWCVCLWGGVCVCVHECLQYTDAQLTSGLHACRRSVCCWWTNRVRRGHNLLYEGMGDLGGLAPGH